MAGEVVVRLGATMAAAAVARVDRVKLAGKNHRQGRQDGNHLREAVDRRHHCVYQSGHVRNRKNRSPFHGNDLVADHVLDGSAGHHYSEIGCPVGDGHRGTGRDPVPHVSSDRAACLRRNCGGAERMPARNSEAVACVFPSASRTETANVQKETYLCLCHSSCPHICLAVVAGVYSVYTHLLGNPNDLNSAPSGLHTVAAVEVVRVYS